jgi:hypothetical protein
MTTTQYFQNNNLSNRSCQTPPLIRHRINEPKPLLPGFIWFLLNNCMSKRHQHYQIQQRAERDDKQTDAWLRAQGFSAEIFSETAVELLEAQRIANRCLSHHSQLLSSKDVDVLNRFLYSMSKRHTRKRIRQARIHQVMNIGNRINRQLFKQLRQQQRKAIN